MTTDTYQITRPIMTADELHRHQVTSYGRDYSESDDGYSDMEAEQSRGWQAVNGWGADGWDLGDWPYVVLYIKTIATNHGLSREQLITRETVPAYALMQICEGDRTVYRFDTEADRDAAVDYLFVWYGLGKDYDEWAVEGLTYDKRDALDAGLLRVPERFRGPYRSRMAVQS